MVDVLSIRTRAVLDLRKQILLEVTRLWASHVRADLHSNARHHGGRNSRLVQVDRRWRPNARSVQIGPHRLMHLLQKGGLEGSRVRLMAGRLARTSIYDDPNLQEGPKVDGANFLV